MDYVIEFVYCMGGYRLSNFNGHICTSDIKNGMILGVM